MKRIIKKMREIIRNINYDQSGKTVEAAEGLLKGIQFKVLASDYCIPLTTTHGPHDVSLSNSDQALIFQDYLDTSLSFRDFVKKCLKENTVCYGLEDTLNMTGLTRQTYKHGIEAEHQRRDSGFNKYLRSLEGVEIVFNALRDARTSVKDN